MPWIAVIVLIAYFPAVLVGYALLPSRRAVLWGMIGGYLLLPAIAMKIAPGVPEINRTSAISYAVLVRDPHEPAARHVDLRAEQLRDRVPRAWRLGLAATGVHGQRPGTGHVPHGGVADRAVAVEGQGAAARAGHEAGRGAGARA